MQEFIEESLEYVEKYGQLIGDRASSGDVFAEKIVDAYSFWYKCPGDGIALILFDEAVKQYRKHYDQYD